MVVRNEGIITIKVKRGDNGDRVEIYSEGLFFPEVIGTLELAKHQVISYEMSKSKTSGGKLPDKDELKRAYT